MPEMWKRTAPTIVSKIGFRTVVSKTFALPSGDIKDFQTFDAEGQQYAGVIGITTDNRAVIVLQYRPGPEKVFAELPGGFVDDGEEPAAAAQREFIEETGYTPGGLTPLGVSYKDAYHNATWHYFLATDCTKTGNQELESTEYAELQLISIAELIDNAMQGRMTDSDAVLMAYEKLRVMQKSTESKEK